ncbi:MAG TPA: ATP-binding protein, partial [Ramlibacter sp.]|uniref:hybrid sensor histidine kinase/response regulator n=1 Tax=Ramlibacter sp. TaxID=1917967 RepID=UPI002ED33C56
AVFGLLYHQELQQAQHVAVEALRATFIKAYFALLLVAGIVAWWLVLAHKSRQVAQEESNRQAHLLMREIDSHRQTDEALQQARQVAEQARHAAEQANQAKSRYISAISHELRTPLNSILGYAQLMGEDAAMPSHRKHAIHVIRRGGEHLLSLIEGTLDIARIESGKLTLSARPMRFADFVHELASLFELQAAAKGLAFRFETQGALPEVVRADEKRVRQILINLLGNAIKFTATGHVVFRVRHAREMAVVEVEDTGPGLPDEELAHVFEPFARGSSAGHAVPGAGLGLTIAKMLTDLMGGELGARSTPGSGSVFRVRLFLPEVHAVLPPQAVPRVRHGYAGARRRILVVDNEEADRELLVALLEPLGFELRTAASGHDALDLVAAGVQPDAILMDLAMPGIDGWETIRRIRRLQPLRAKIAVVSANAFDKGLENDAGIRPEDFILKPVRHGELLDWLERQLGLQWLEAPAPAMPPAVPATLPAVRPREDLLAPLRHAVQLGYYRGILQQLDAIDTQQPECAAFTGALRELARQFQFEAIARELARPQSEGAMP